MEITDISVSLHNSRKNYLSTDFFIITSFPETLSNILSKFINLFYDCTSSSSASLLLLLHVLRTFFNLIFADKVDLKFSKVRTYFPILLVQNSIFINCIFTVTLSSSDIVQTHTYEPKRSTFRQNYYI